MVASVLMDVNKGQNMRKFLNMKPIELPHGPWAMKDTQGFKVMIEMLLASQDKGCKFSGYV